MTRGFERLKTLGRTGAMLVAVALPAAAVPGAAHAQTAPTAAPTAGAPPPPAAAMPPPPKPAPPAPPASPAPAAAPPPPAPAPAKPADAGPMHPPPDKPPAELEPLKFFEGSWRCDGKAPANPFGPEHAYKSTFKFKKEMNGFWYALDYQQKKSKVHPRPMTAHGHVGYDAAAKKLVSLGIDSIGGWVLETSPGWEGDKLVWSGEGSVMGQKVGFRETFAKTGDRQMVWTGEIKLGKDWTLLGTDTCKR